METSTPPSGRRNSLAIGVAVAVAFVLVDQATKLFVERTLDRGVFVPWLSDDIGWQLVYNDGAAFGLPAPSWVFPIVTLVVVVMVLRTLPSVWRLVPIVGYGMLLAGALGNVVDRVFRAGDPGDPAWLHGHVVDFVAWGTFPRFNIADSVISVGLALLLLEMFRAPQSSPMRHGEMMVDLGGSGSASSTVRVIGSDELGGAPHDPDPAAITRLPAEVGIGDDTRPVT